MKEHKSEDDFDLGGLLADLCNEALSPESQAALEDLLSQDSQALLAYVKYVDLHASLRSMAQTYDEEGFLLLEAQAALDTMQSEVADVLPATPASKNDGNSRFDNNSRSAWLGRHRLESGRGKIVAATVAIATLIVMVLVLGAGRNGASPADGIASADRQDRSSQAPGDAVELAWEAKLRGAVGARWGGDLVTITEGTALESGKRLDLVEGLAEIEFISGARLVLQGPAIIEICDGNSAQISVGRFTTTPGEDAADFTAYTRSAELRGANSEFGAEVDVDGSIVTRVYAGEMAVHSRSAERGAAPVVLSAGDAVRYDAGSHTVRSVLPQQALHFVRFLPKHETFVNLVDVVAGGDGFGTENNRGISLIDGQLKDDYGTEPAEAARTYLQAKTLPLVDGLFVPDGSRGANQVDSIGRTYDGFPATRGDCWGAVVMARRPAEERTLPRIRLEFHGGNYGYVNWLHTASRPEELSPKGYGLIGMHANSGITFDLHAIRSAYPHKTLKRFSSLVGNLESKDERFAVEAWVLVDGQLRYHRDAFSREDGPEQIDIELTERDRFLVLAVTDVDKSASFDWAVFGDPVVEMAPKGGAAPWNSTRSVRQGEQLLALGRRAGRSGPGATTLATAARFDQVGSFASGE